MRLAAVSVVKNEADVIEPFLRHTLAWADHLLVFDHQSTDGTREVLLALRREGLPLRLFTDGSLGNRQQARSNFLARMAAESGADWIMPLDADEILVGPGRAELETALRRTGDGVPTSLPLRNYYPTEKDDACPNPVLRLSYCQKSASNTRKLIVPRALALDPTAEIGKGSHVITRNAAILAAQPLPEEFFLAHLPLRSPQHQALRVILAELQKLSGGRTMEGVDNHYRLGFQLLATDPAAFFATMRCPADRFTRRPIPYLGGAPRYGLAEQQGWDRVSRALLPYLEQLALSHGHLADQARNNQNNTDGSATLIREVPAEERASPIGLDSSRGPAFVGFRPLSGWGDQEGPVPEAFLPPFHWAMAPSTQLAVFAETPGDAFLTAEALTYSHGQAVSVKVNDAEVLVHQFGRINQRDSIRVPLRLQAGENRISLHYRTALVTEYDPRRLAVIFLSLRIVQLSQN